MASDQNLESLQFDSNIKQQVDRQFAALNQFRQTLSRQIEVSEQMNDHFGQLHTAILDLQHEGGHSALALQRDSSNSSNEETQEMDDFVILPDKQDRLTKDMRDKRQRRGASLEADKKVRDLLRERTEKLISLSRQFNEQQTMLNRHRALLASQKSIQDKHFQKLANS